MSQAVKRKTAQGPAFSGVTFANQAVLDTSRGHELVEGDRQPMCPPIGFTSQFRKDEPLRIFRDRLKSQPVDKIRVQPNNRLCASISLFENDDAVFGVKIAPAQVGYIRKPGAGAPAEENCTSPS